jgi:hypothetical protein
MVDDLVPLVLHRLLKLCRSRSGGT